jgi:hypothetical protein
MKNRFREADLDLLNQRNIIETDAAMQPPI